MTMMTKNYSYLKDAVILINSKGIKLAKNLLPISLTMISNPVNGTQKRA